MPNDIDDRPRSLVVIGDPQSRRLIKLREAATQCDLDMSAISYGESLRADFWHRCCDSNTLVRIESPGDHWETTRLLLQSGIEPMEQLRRVPLRASELPDQPYERGEIVHPLQWFLGFSKTLQQIEELGESSGVRWMNSPTAISTTFDKQHCCRLWSTAGLPVPPAYEDIKTYSRLREAITDRHARLFIKLRYGYSAMGAVALEWRDNLVRAITSVEVTWNAGRPRLFVTKRPRVLQHEFEIAWLIDTLAMEEIVVEDWLPKARWHGKQFDLRIVAIGGRAKHVVGRANSSPFTNLNLDADRIDRADVEQHLGSNWHSVISLAEQAAKRISGAWYLGMDVLVRPCLRRAVILEANAFGDNLPCLLSDGQTTYEAELRTYLATVDKREMSDSLV